MDKFVREDLREAVLCEKQEQRVIGAERILVEKHWVRLFTDLTFTIFIFVFLFLHLLFRHDFFIIEVDVEQDLSRVFFQ